MTGYRVSAAVEFLARHGGEKFGVEFGGGRPQRREGRRIMRRGEVKGTREARGVFRASCRGVQQVIVFGIHLHASSVPSLSLSLSLSHLSLLSFHPPSPVRPPRRTLYVILSTVFLSTGRRACYPPAGFIRLRFLAKIRAKGVSRGILTVADLSQ